MGSGLPQPPGPPGWGAADVAASQLRFDVLGVDGPGLPLALVHRLQRNYSDPDRRPGRVSLIGGQSECR